LKGYIYTQYEGADPSTGWAYSDPIFGKTPTLGACLPNIRRAIEEGDWFFSISGRVPKLAQFVVGGFRVAEKIDQLAAHGRFPENRVHHADNGQVVGNVIVSPDGKQDPIDNHKNFEKRLENFLVGSDPIVVDAPGEIERARRETLPVLQRIFQKEGNRVFDVIGRGRRMNEEQAKEMQEWLHSIKN
jgi:hypothetical protein